ncbi:MAG: hypothetical protein IJX98_07575 [Clostridia bacterium]|nr:hypothetical protein [Clostridia bacterium]
MANFKKYAIAALSLTMLAALGTAVACDNSNNDDNHTPTTYTYTVNVELPAEATAPTDWYLQYCNGDVCKEATITNGVATFTTEEDKAYELTVMNALPYEQAEEVTTEVGTYTYTINMSLIPQGEEGNPYTADLDTYNTTSVGITKYTLTMQAAGTLKFTTYAEDGVLAIEDADGTAVAFGNELTLDAGTYEYYVTSTAADMTFYAKWVDGSEQGPFVIGGENAANPLTTSTPVGTWYYQYDNYVYEAKQFTVATQADNCVVKIDDYGTEVDSLIVSGLNFTVKVVNTGTEAADWTLTYADPPEGVEANPKAVSTATTLEDITLASGASYYINLQGQLAFTVPTGCTAYYRQGMMPVTVQAGEVVAYAEPQMMGPGMYYPLTVCLTNTSAAELTVDVVVTAYTAPAGSNASAAVEVSLTAANTATVDGQTVYWFKFTNTNAQNGTLTITLTDATSMVLTAANYGSWQPNQPVCEGSLTGTVTVSEYEEVVYLCLTAAEYDATTMTGSFTVTFTPATAA